MSKIDKSVFNGIEEVINNATIEDLPMLEKLEKELTELEKSLRELVELMH